MKKVIVIRKDLNVSTGKMMSAIVHASDRTGTPLKYENEDPVVITTYVNSEKALLKLEAKCIEAGIPCGLQRDGGRNEVDTGTVMALCIGPASEDVINPITKRLQLVKFHAYPIC